MSYAVNEPAPPALYTVVPAVSVLLALAFSVLHWKLLADAAARGR